VWICNGPLGGVLLSTYLHEAEINLHNTGEYSVRVGGCAA